MTTTAVDTRRQVGVAAVVTAAFGSLVLGYGLFLIPLSPLGGLWIAAIGLSFVLAAAFASPWIVTQLGVSADLAGRLSLGFALVAALLAVAFVLVNGIVVEAGSASN